MTFSNMHKFILHYGNHPKAWLFWCALGIVCGGFASMYLVTSAFWLNIDAAWMFPLGALVFLAVYMAGLAAYSGDSDFVRQSEGRPWYFSAIGNGFMYVATIAVGSSRYGRPTDIVGFTFLAVSALGFLEVTTPAVDYGLLQAFLRFRVLLAIHQWQQGSVVSIFCVIPPLLLAAYGILLFPWIEELTVEVCDVNEKILLLATACALQLFNQHYRTLLDYKSFS